MQYFSKEKQQNQTIKKRIQRKKMDELILDAKETKRIFHIFA